MSTQASLDTLTVDTPDKSSSESEIRIAGQRGEREEAFRLIYESYLRTGLAKPNRLLMRLLPHHLLPTTDLFVAGQQGKIVATVTLIRDGKLGLPIDSVYADEVAQLRRNRKVLGEVSCLADQGRKTLPHCMELFRLMVQTARARGVHALVVAVHPKHARFYERWLAFQRIGEEAAYPAVCDRPAVALLLDFERIDRERPVNYQRFFGCPIDRELLQPRPLSPADYAYFRRVLATTDGRSAPIEMLDASSASTPYSHPAFWGAVPSAAQLTLIAS